MKTGIWLSLAFAILVVTSSALSQHNNKAQNLYQEALIQMEGRGNLNKALEIFGQIIKDFPENRQICAQSQLQIGVCYEKMGKREAEKAYEQVIKDFSDQREVVAEARSRLRALGGVKDLKLTKLYSGSWVDCISPDGKQLLMGTSIRDIESGKETSLPIEHGMLKGQVVWSPDSKMIAYVDNRRNLCVVPITGGSSILILKGDSATVMDEDGTTPRGWTADSRKVIYHDPSKGLRAIAASGGEAEDILVFKDPERAREYQDMTLSPDGMLVAYVSSQNGSKDIYVMPVKSGESIRLTTNPTEDRNPIWSHDGRWIAFLSKRGESSEIWAAKVSPEGKPEGSEVQVTRGGYWGGNWTQDGRFGYCTAFRLEHVYSANPDGSEEFQVTHFPALNGSPVWYPGGRKIAFKSDYGRRLNDFRMWAVSSKGGEAELVVLAKNARLGTCPPALSPDGNSICFIVSDELHRNKSVLTLVPAAGGESRELLSLEEGVDDLDWSPDGKKIMVTHSVEPTEYVDTDGYMSERRGGISILSSEGGEAQTLMHAERKGVAYLSCRWSPDGNRIAFRTFDFQEWVRGGRKEEGFGLWVQDLKTGDSRLILKGADGYKLCWSPDGRSIIFERRVNGMDFDLYTIPADGGTAEKLNIKGRSAVFSPDGKKIAYSRRLTGGYEFWLVENFLPTEGNSR